MAESVGTIYYEVEADTAKLVSGGQQVDNVLGNMQSSFSKTDKAANASQFQMTKTASAVQELGRQAQAAQNPLGGLGKVLGGLLTLQGVNGLIQMAESYNEMGERVKMATRSTEEYELVQQRLLKTANGTYRALSEAQEVFIGTSDNIRDMGYTLEQALDITDSLSYSFVRNATATDRAQNAMRAYDMALNKGKVGADGWLTIVGAIPSVANDIAKSMGVSAQEVREMGASGKITADMLNQGLLKSLQDNKDAADGMAATMRDAFTRIKNNLSAFVGEANKAHGVTALMTSGLNGLADSLETLVSLLAVAGAGVLAKYIASTTAASIASARAMMAARAQAAEELRLASAHAATAAAASASAAANIGLAGSAVTAAAASRAHAAALTQQAAAQAAASAAGVGLLGILGGPAGIIALVASAAAGIYIFGNRSSEAAPKVDELTASVDKLSASQLESRRLQASDAIEQLTIKARSAGSAVKSLEKDQAALNAQLKSGRGGITSEGLDNVNKSLIEAKSNADSAVKELQEMINADYKLAEAQKQRTSAAAGSVRAQQSDPEVRKRLQGMREELELAKLTGESKARLQAIQKLGANATAEERAEAEKLASTIFKIEESRKGGAKTEKKSVADQAKAAEEAKKYLENLQRQSQEVKGMTSQEKLRYDLMAGVVKLQGDQLAAAQSLAAIVDHRENASAIADMAKALSLASLEGEALAKAQALAQLNKFATQEDIDRVNALAEAVFKAQQAQADKQALGSLDPAAGAAKAFEDEMNQLRRLNESKLIEDQRYFDLKAEKELAYQEQSKALQEEAFRRQSASNDLLMSSVDALGQQSASALSGLLTGATSGADAMRALAGAVMNEVVGSFVKMGVAQVKAWVMGRTAQASAAAGYVASVTGQVAATTALAAQAAFASTAAIPIVGPALAPGAAALAGSAAAALGAPAIAGASATLAGGRQYGGPVAPGKMYRINETGAPEVLNMANGQQFMLPNGRGQVVSNKDATASQNGSIAPRITVNLIEDGSRGGQVDQQQVDDQYILSVFVNSIRKGTDAAGAMEGTYGVSRRGR